MLTSDCKRTLYYSLVYPYLTYGLEVYGLSHFSVLKPLLITCNRALRVLQNKPRDYPVTSLYANFNTLPMNLLFKYVLLILVYRCMNISSADSLPIVVKNMFVLNSNIHGHSTRAQSNIHLFKNSCSNSLGSGTYLGSSLWNDMPLSLKNSRNLVAFKKNLKPYLLSIS